MANIKFGTDGWRALMDKEFTFENVERLSQAFAGFVLETKKKSGSAGPLRTQACSAFPTCAPLPIGSPNLPPTMPKGSTLSGAPL